MKEKQNDKPITKSGMLADESPMLIPFWHPTKNGDNTPYNTKNRSVKGIWWRCERGHEWQRSPHQQPRIRICPYCSNRKFLKGYNDLETLRPELAAQWHPTKNGDLKPSDVSTGYSNSVWWMSTELDPTTNQYFDFEWESSVAYRVRTPSVPLLNNKRVFVGINDLATVNPPLALEWNVKKNGNITPRDVTTKSSKEKVWWKCDRGHEWADDVYHRHIGYGCPHCREEEVLDGTWKRRKAIVGVDDLATTHPELAAQWHPTKNKLYTSQDLTANATNEVWWIYSYDDPETQRHYDFVWQESVRKRVLKPACPFLTGTRKWPGFNDSTEPLSLGFIADFEVCNTISEELAVEDVTEKLFA